MINGWGNPNAKFVILGTDPTAPNSDPAGIMKYPFNLPDCESVRRGERSIRTRYFYPIYDNIETILDGEDKSVTMDVTRYIADNFLITNAIGAQVRDEDGEILETGRSIRKKDQGSNRNIWLNTFLGGEEDGKTHKTLLQERICNKTVFLTTSYLLQIFSEESWFKKNTNITKGLTEEIYGNGERPKCLMRSGNSYNADFYLLYRHKTYRLSDAGYEKYRLCLKRMF